MKPKEISIATVRQSAFASKETIVSYFKRFWAGYGQEYNPTDPKKSVMYKTFQWEQNWRPVKPFCEGMAQGEKAKNKKIKGVVAYDEADKATNREKIDQVKNKLFLIQGDPKISTEGHDKVTSALGAPPQGIRLDGTHALKEFGVFRAMVTVVNRLEREQWCNKGEEGKDGKKGFDFVLFDMNPHPTFFNLLAMIRYVLCFPPVARTDPIRYLFLTGETDTAAQI